jgi:hypothetical protein
MRARSCKYCKSPYSECSQNSNIFIVDRTEFDENQNELNICKLGCTGNLHPQARIKNIFCNKTLNGILARKPSGSCSNFVATPRYVDALDTIQLMHTYNL